jgi:hypothetical protein
MARSSTRSYTGHQESVDNSDHIFPMASQRTKLSSVSRKLDSFSATRDVSSSPQNTNGRSYTGTEIGCHIIRAVLKAIRANSMVIGGKQTLVRNTEIFRQNEAKWFSIVEMKLNTLSEGTSRVASEGLL